MAPQFGTSGLRGLVTDLTDDLVADHVRAFLRACPTGGAVHVGRDLRPSSPRIAEAVLRAVADAGLTAIDAGAVPTPALALRAMAQGHAAVMVTGSHIPADRNGLKFYLPTGEITKTDEAAIKAGLGAPAQALDGAMIRESGVSETYAARYVDAFGPDALTGLTIGIYQHSTVARDVMTATVEALGARAVALARSDAFVPVDTEAIAPDVAEALAGWCAELGLDAVISADGDADRPLVADATGRIVPGDVLGPLTARLLGAGTIVTPVSSNSLVDEMPAFARVLRTRIGSPYVIAAMEEVRAQDPAARVVGYEANGGFLLGFTAPTGHGSLAPLMTRDCLLPALAPLVAARRADLTLADLVAGLPPRFTAADRLAGIATERSAALIAKLSESTGARADFFGDMGAGIALDLTDGLRVTFPQGRVVHLRPSGNAPECRCYAEANTPDEARQLVADHLRKLKRALA